MKRLVLLVLIAFVISGCGSNKKEKPYEGVTEKIDYISKGKMYLSKGDVTQAIKSFDQAIKEDPKNPDKYIILGEVYMQLKDFPRAVDSFSAATRVDPINGKAFYFKALSKALQIREGKETPDTLALIRKEAVEAAEKSIIIFKKKGDTEMLSKAAVLLKSLLPNTEPQAPEQEQQDQ